MRQGKVENEPDSWAPGWRIHAQARAGRPITGAGGSVIISAMDMYDDAPWARISGPPPLAGLQNEDLMLVHRHWMWANQQREWFYDLLGERGEFIEPEMYLAEKTGGSMVVWYGLLWAIIEALRDDRTIDLRDPLGADIDKIADPLRRCRNAVLHVPRSAGYSDQRILDLIAHPDSVRLIRMIHTALGRLLVEEMRRRNP